MQSSLYAESDGDLTVDNSSVSATPTAVSMDADNTRMFTKQLW